MASPASSPPASPSAAAAAAAQQQEQPEQQQQQEGQPQYKPLTAWKCWYCNKLNHPIRWFCFDEKCKEYRRPPQLKKGAWKCVRNPNCNALNHEIRRRCFKCSTERDDPNWAYPPGPWTCTGGGDSPCKALNHPIRTKCFKCDADRPMFECLWFCDKCETSNFKEKDNCEVCGTANPEAPPPEVVIPVVPLVGTGLASAPPTPNPLAVAVATGPPPTPVEERVAERYLGQQEQFRYKGEFYVSSHYVTTNLSEFLPGLKEEVPKIDDVLRQCLTALEDKKSNGTGVWPPFGLTDDEALALVVYTFDLGLSVASAEENFYFKVNTVLRERLQERLQKWAPYLYHLQEALKKLPDYEGRVYRGYKNADFVKEEYKFARKIHWSAFTSTTMDRGQAVGFAGQENGALLEMHVFRGKDIRAFSVFEREAEVLLSPNSVLMVTEAKQGEDGLFHVKLIEERERVQA